MFFFLACWMFTCFYYHSDKLEKGCLKLSVSILLCENTHIKYIGEVLIIDTVIGLWVCVSVCGGCREYVWVRSSGRIAQQSNFRGIIPPTLKSVPHIRSVVDIDQLLANKPSTIIPFYNPTPTPTPPPHPHPRAKSQLDIQRYIKNTKIIPTLA